MQPWRTPFPIWNQSVVPCPVLTVASWPAYRFLKRQVRWSAFPSLEEFSTVYSCNQMNKINNFKNIKINKMGNVSTIPVESPLMYILDKWSDYSRELRTHECEESILLKHFVATAPVRVSKRALGAVILGPCTKNCYPCCVNYVICSLLCHWCM